MFHILLEISQKFDIFVRNQKTFPIIVPFLPIIVQTLQVFKKEVSIWIPYHTWLLLFFFFLTNTVYFLSSLPSLTLERYPPCRGGQSYWDIGTGTPLVAR